MSDVKVISKKKWFDYVYKKYLLALLQTVNSTWYFPHHMVFYEVTQYVPCTMLCFINIVHGAEKTAYYLLFAIEL